MYLCSELVKEEPKEPGDPAVRAKENWLRLFEKVRQQLQEVRLTFLWQVYTITGPRKSLLCWFISCFMHRYSYCSCFVKECVGKYKSQPQNDLNRNEFKKPELTQFTSWIHSWCFRPRYFTWKKMLVFVIFHLNRISTITANPRSFSLKFIQKCVTLWK